MNNIKLTTALFAAGIFSFNAAYSHEKTSETRTEQAAVKAAQSSTISVESLSPAIAKVHFSNAPVNLIVPETVVSLNEAIKELSKDENIKVVIFTSDVKGYFFNHFDTNEFPNFLSQVDENSKPLWVELITSISNAPFVTIASIRGRTVGGGDELTLAFDLRYASKEKAKFGQPEVGIGLFPGGGGTNLLTRLAGRDRALEVFLSSDDYNAELAEKYGWVTRAIPDAQLDDFVEKMAHRLATFDKTALMTAKKQINAIALPTEAELLNSYVEFTKSLSWPGLQQRLPVFDKLTQEAGIEKVEKHLGYYIGEGNRQLQDSTGGKK